MVPVKYVLVMARCESKIATGLEIVSRPQANVIAEASRVRRELIQPGPNKPYSNTPLESTLTHLDFAVSPLNHKTDCECVVSSSQKHLDQGLCLASYV